MRKALSRKFFNRDTMLLAQELLGKVLVRKLADGNVISGMITEVEAYDGFDDRASHASRGETPRNAVMFGHPGFWYVYFTYGMHWMLNVVTREKGYPAAILIRAAIVDGMPYSKTNGPAKLTKFFGIDKRFNALSAARKSDLWIEDRGAVPEKIRKGKRIGVEYAGPWKDAPRRFFIAV